MGPQNGRTQNALEILRAGLKNVRGPENKFTARCPGHDDHRNSLSVMRKDDGKICVHCFADCTCENILAPLNLSASDLYPPTPEKFLRKETTYDYTDAEGKFVFQVVRKSNKTFPQRRPNPNDPGEWIWDLEGVERHLYRLPEVVKAIASGQDIYLVEGEKDAINLAKLGLCTTTSAGGIGHWTKSDVEELADANVIILPDNDERGLEGAQKRHRTLPGSIVVKLPGLSNKEDVSDWIERGGTRAQLEALVQEARANLPESSKGHEPDTSGIVQSATNTLRSGAPLDLARHVLAQGYSKENLVFWCGEWFSNRTGDAYKFLETVELEKLCYRSLEGCTYEQTRPDGRVFSRDIVPDIRLVGQVLHAARSLPGVLLPSDSSPPFWRNVVSGYPPAEELISLRNGLLHIQTRRLYPHNPSLFNLNALSFDYDPDAKARNLVTFLESSLPGEAGIAAEKLLAEWFGYCLSPNNDRQKMLWLIGAKRSGKGTISRLLTRLLGSPNVCAPQLSTFGELFALQSLLGKRLAVFGDAASGQFGAEVVAERIRNISGCDMLSVPRKHKDSMNLVLPTKLMFCANEPPSLSDCAGALAARLLCIDFPVSFAGKEDPKLEERLCAELSGVLNWALDGFDRLQRQEQFTEVVSDWRAAFARSSNPVLDFIEERCERKNNLSVVCTTLHAAYSDFCKEVGNRPFLSQAAFGSKLKAAAPEVVRARATASGDGNRPWIYQNIGLKELA